MCQQPVLKRARGDGRQVGRIHEQRNIDRPQTLMHEATRAMFCADQPLATHSTIGTTKLLHAATAKTLQAFHDRCYRPENVVISIAGDGDPKMFEQYVREYFADWEGKGKTQPVPDYGKAEIGRAHV